MENEKQSCKAHLLERIDEALGQLRGEIVYLERVKDFVSTQEVDHLEGDVGTMVSRSLSFTRWG